MTMMTATEPEKKVFDEATSDDAVLEQLGYTQGIVLAASPQGRAADLV